MMIRLYYCPTAPVLRQLLYRQHVADMNGADPEFLFFLWNRVTSLFCIQPSYFLLLLVCSLVGPYAYVTAGSTPGSSACSPWPAVESGSRGCAGERAVGGELLPLHHHYQHSTSGIHGTLQSPAYLQAESGVEMLFGLENSRE